MKERASVTIYFSLILIILLAVIITTVESARLAGIRVRCQSASALGLESLFADYASPLFEEYGLLFLEASYGTGEEEAYFGQYRDYVSYNADCNYRDYIGNDFYRSEITGVSAEKVIYATDKEGKALEKQIHTTIVGDIPMNLLEDVLGRLELSNQCGLLTEFFDGVSRISDRVNKVDKAVQKIYEKTEELKELQEDLEEKTEELKDLIEQLDSAEEDYKDAETEEEEKEAWKDIVYYKKQIASLRKSVLDQEEKMQKAAKIAVEQETIYKEKTQEVSEKLTELRQELLEGKEEIRVEITEAIEKQTADIRRFSGGEGDIYQVEAAEDSLRDYKEIITEAIKSVKSAGSDENQLLSVLEEQNSSFYQSGMSQVKIIFDNHYQGQSEGGIFQTIKGLLAQGMTGFVMQGKEISSASLEKKELPSVEYGKETGIVDFFKELFCTDQLAGERLESGKETLLTDEYVLRYFTDVTDKEENTEEWKHVLSYEAEYVLCGEGADRKNLEKTIQEMLLLRTGMNLIYLLSDTESCSQAQAIAIGIVGFTGMMGLIRVTQLLLLAAWAYGEALVDVRNLVDGGKVAFLKTKSDWKVGISELKNLEKLGTSFTEDTKGLDYQEYMHILMIKENQSQKLYRIMDILQANMRYNGWEGFRMDRCIYALQIKTDFFAKPLFLNISPFANLGEMGGYSVQTSYGDTY